MLVFPDSAPVRLGLQIVMEDVASHLVSEAGRDLLESDEAGGTETEVRQRLARVFEVQQALRFDDPLAWSELPDVRPLLKQLRPAGSLADGAQFLDLAGFLTSVGRLRAYFGNRRERYPAVAELLANLSDFREIEKTIAASIGRDGEVADDASAELRRLRRAISTHERDLRKSLNEELRAAIASGFATEEQPTIRNGRMVIPVRAEAKRKVRGFVQDSSATGQTVYIEPASCLELNNELRELQAEEGREVRRILISIGDAVRARLAELHEAVATLSRFDVVYAKARTADKLDGVIPRLNGGTTLSIVDGRNPALVLRFLLDSDGGDRRTVVPITVDLSREQRTLLITGPNAGGKTVAMTTVGLLALMVGHGIPVPADEKTELPIFQKILVDIGDEQSIEHDLSTFSAHLQNLARMMHEADQHTLVLIDEAGTGTDPDEGAALAQAALERLTNAGAWTIATTHHGRLKAFAHEHPNVRNGAMEFDRKTLSPTYRFRIDVPGSSFAFDIGRRMGFPEDLLTRARDLMGDQEVALEDLIGDYEDKVGQLAALTAAAEQERDEMRSVREEYEASLGKLKDDRSRTRQEALRAADRLLSKANAEIERTIREIKESEADRSTTRAARQRLESFRADVEEEIAKLESDVESHPDDHGGAELHVGDQVVVDDGSVKAEVAELDDTHAVVVNKAVRMRVTRDRLRRVGGKRSQHVEVREITAGAASGAGLPAHALHRRVDLRGQRVEEALAAVGRFIDTALPSSLKRLEILHGKGTGALRNAIWEYLDTRPEVAAFEEADIEQGGAGITVVHLQ